MDFSRLDAALIALSGKATSMSFLRCFTEGIRAYVRPYGTCGDMVQKSWRMGSPHSGYARHWLVKPPDPCVRSYSLVQQPRDLHPDPLRRFLRLAVADMRVPEGHAVAAVAQQLG